MKEVHIHDEYITLGQLLKKVDILSTGGQVKWFLQENQIFINGAEESRRGKKIFPNDIVEVEGFGKFKITLGRNAD